MANWTILKEAIAHVVKTNGNQEITGTKYTKQYCKQCW